MYVYEDIWWSTVAEVRGRVEDREEGSFVD